VGADGATRLRIEVCDDVSDVACRVADVICALLDDHPAAVLGLSTGATPLPIYRELIRRVVSGEVTARSARVFLLDEYVGLASDDPRSYRATILREATRPLGIPDDQVVGPCGEAGDLESAAAAYDRAIDAAGGIDLQLAGIGRNSHVAFNEPGTPWNLRTHVATLTADTRSANASFFPDGDVPVSALTQGPATIAAARRIVLVATGGHKAAAVAAAVAGPVTEACPASMLQCHDDALVVVDRDAARLLDPSGRG
jgi:glucosamine-6-phosphate deaminase